MYLIRISFNRSVVENLFVLKAKCSEVYQQADRIVKGHGIVLCLC